MAAALRTPGALVTVDLRCGDTRTLIDDVADGSISLVATSPPFLNLRAYLPAEHEAKQHEIGSEHSPAAFLDTLLQLTARWGDKLADWGSIAIELGDTYAGSGGGGGDYLPGGLRDGQQQFAGSASSMRESNAAHWRQNNRASARRDRAELPANNIGGPGWPAAKSLALLPQLYAVALAYGIHPLTGEPSPAGRWLVRNVITWHRNNPPVGRLADKYRPSTSYITVATRTPDRWFDLTAVRSTESEDKRQLRIVGEKTVTLQGGELGERARYAQGTTGGSPPHTGWFDEHDSLIELGGFDADSHLTWTINTQPSRLQHYAMWPARLAERLILSMCPSEVCTQCGQPRRRIEENSAAYQANQDAALGRKLPPVNGRSNLVTGKRMNAEKVTQGWTSCDCAAGFRPGIVLDPFSGASTTPAVADLHGRDAIGLELNQASLDLYERRRAECARALFDSPIPDDNQGVLQL